MLAAIIFKKEPLFQGEDNYDQLVKITKVLGYDGLQQVLKKYNLKLDSHYDGVSLKYFAAFTVTPSYPRKPWTKFINPENQALCSSDALDLIDKMLQYDHAARITPRECFDHPFFDMIKKNGTIKNE